MPRASCELQICSTSVAFSANRSTTHPLHRPCRVVAGRSRSQPVERRGRAERPPGRARRWPRARRHPPRRFSFRDGASVLTGAARRSPRRVRLQRGAGVHVQTQPYRNSRRSRSTGAPGRGARECASTRARRSVEPLRGPPARRPEDRPGLMRRSAASDTPAPAPPNSPS
jgi:hypothetical protein